MAIGSDLELFLEANGQPFPAIGFGLPHKGNNPIPLEDYQGVSGYVHRDNLMVEMNALVSSTGAELARNISRVMSSALRWLNREKDGALSWYGSSSAQFPPDTLETEHASELGCDSDFISTELTSHARLPWAAPQLGAWRYCGGHLHFSYENENIPPWVASMVCDLFIGIPESRKVDVQRAKFYGSLSLHRPTSYPNGSSGVEYRPLDSYWVRNPIDRSRVCLLAEQAEDFLNNASLDDARRVVGFHMATFNPTIQILPDVTDEIVVAAAQVVRQLTGRPA